VRSLGTALFVSYYDVSVKSRYRTASRFALLGTPAHWNSLREGWCYMPDSCGICHEARVPPTFRTLRPQKASLRAPCGACHEVYLPLLCKHTWEKTYDTNIILLWLIVACDIDHSRYHVISGSCTCVASDTVDK